MFSILSDCCRLALHSADHSFQDFGAAINHEHQAKKLEAIAIVHNIKNVQGAAPPSLDILESQMVMTRHKKKMDNSVTPQLNFYSLSSLGAVMM